MKRIYLLASIVATAVIAVGASVADADSGAISNVHANGEAVKATFSVSFDSCGSSCYWYPVAYQFPVSHGCSPNSEHPVWIGETHTAPGAEAATEAFFPEFAGSLRICLYVNGTSGDKLLAQAVYKAPPPHEGHLSFDRPCYREGEGMRITGRGLRRGDVYTVSFSRGRKNQTAFTEKKGRFTLRVDAPSITALSPPPPIQRKVGVYVTESYPIVPGGPTARGSFSVTTVGAKITPGLHGAIPRAVRFEISGFDPGRRVYAHWWHRGHLVENLFVGRAHGACGTLRSRRFPFRERVESTGGWTIEFDQSPRPRVAGPDAHISFTVFTVFGRLRTH